MLEEEESGKSQNKGDSLMFDQHQVLLDTSSNVIYINERVLSLTRNSDALMGSCNIEIIVFRRTMYRVGMVIIRG